MRPPYLTAPPLTIDIEASGFGANSYPIEVGFALPDGRTYCRLIQPATHWTHWDHRASEIHCIERETLATHGHPIEEITLWLNDSLEGQTVFSDAWANDLSWLSLLFDQANRIQRFAIESLRTIMSDAQAALWAQTKSEIVQELNLTRHRASSDALILQRTYIRTCELIRSGIEPGRSTYSSHPSACPSS